MTATAPITIDSVYPWGRTFDEYRRMFALSDADLRGRVLSVADGPASFNAEMAARGGRVVSCDPLYRFDAETIRARVEATGHVMLDLVRKNAHRFVWDRIASPEALSDLRLGAMRRFLADFERGRDEGRYLDRSLPDLDFADDAFDVAVCSHFLFLYGNDFPLAFHVESLLEMSRVAADVRVFPLLDMAGERSAHLEPAIAALSDRGLAARIVRVDYEFQRGGNEMLRITRAAGG